MEIRMDRYLYELNELLPPRSHRLVKITTIQTKRLTLQKPIYVAMLPHEEHVFIVPSPAAMTQSVLIQ